MIDTKETMYHLEKYKRNYFTFCCQLTLLLLGVMLIGIANHDKLDILMESIGILFLMGSILWFSIYVSNIICCPDKDIYDICCNNNDYEIW
jgi:archaellum biogenesis protein FlaJ (TadC family)